VDADDGVLVPELHTGAQHAVDLLLHLGVAPLDRVEVELRHVLALHHARGRAAAHADAVGGAADLHDPHAFRGQAFLRVPRIHLADAAAEHDRLDPLTPLAIGQA